MKACLTYNFEDMRIVEVPTPKIRNGWVLVRVEVCQPSVTDVMRSRGVGSSGVKEIKSLLEKESPYQLFGHEFSGEIEEVGEGVTRFQQGQRVSSLAYIYCEKCINCQRGEHDFCISTKRIGVNFPGCFAEYVLLPERALEPVPEGIDANEAACLQPISNAFAFVEGANIKVGDTVAVIGLGAIGLYCAQFAKLYGAGTIIGVDIKPENLEIAKKVGVDVVINAKAKDTVDYIKSFTTGVGADVIFECAGGNPEEGLSGHKTIGQAFESIRKGGTIIQVSHPLPGKIMPFELTTLTKKKIKYIGLPTTTKRHFYQAANLVALNKVKVKPMITHVVEGINRVSEAFEITGNKTKYKATNPAQVVISKD